MIKRDQKKDALPTIVDFVEFARSYKDCADFKKWFCYLENLLSGLNRAKDDARWNRLIVFAINLRVFVSFLDPTSRQTAPRQIYYLNALHPKVAERVRNELVEAGYSTMIQSEC
jgi:hypothetical protein